MSVRGSSQWNLQYQLQTELLKNTRRVDNPQPLVHDAIRWAGFLSCVFISATRTVDVSVVLAIQGLVYSMATMTIWVREIKAGKQWLRFVDDFCTQACCCGASLRFSQTDKRKA